MKAVKSRKYKFFFTHRTKVAWSNTFNRCRNFEVYKRKGIKVCDRWSDFKNFVDDMGQAPEGMYLDRINTLGDYSPDNCRWTTQKENCRNTTSNHVIEGKCISQHAEELGIKANTLLYRIRRKSKKGMSADIRRPIKVLCVETGVVYSSVTEAAHVTGANAGAIRRCFRIPEYTSGGYHWVKYLG